MSLSQDIESRIQILDIVNRYVQTKKAWVNYKWLCPFHTEKTPSFVVSPQKNIAHCFSCGKGWWPINFLMEIEKIDFREAIQILAKEAGIELKTQFREGAGEKWKDLYKLYREAARLYHEALYLPENAHALTYLLQRGMSQETIKKFELGYSGSPRDMLYALKNLGFETQFVIDSGIFVSESRDKFFGRIVFPIANSMGHVVAFTGRVLGDGMPKYLNSPASEIFDKSSILYGLHLAKQSIAKTGEVFIVEGQMDTIALHQAGVDNAVGISGTALTKEHIRFLRRFARVIYLSLDSDAAGIKATFASIENLLNEDLEIRIIAIPSGKDPDEFLKSGGDFFALRSTSLSMIEFYLTHGQLEFDLATIIGRKKLIEKCLEIVVKLKSDIEVDQYLRQIAKSLDVSMDILYSEYKKTKISLGRKAQAPLSDDPTDTATTFAPTVPDLVAGYIYRYQFLDLFSQEFRYTTLELSQLNGAWLLMRLISGDPLDAEDVESLRILDLYIEETHTHSHPDVIMRNFRDLLRQLHSTLLLVEKSTLLGDISPDQSEYLETYKNLVLKAQSLGLPPGVLKL